MRIVRHFAMAFLLAAAPYSANAQSSDPNAEACFNKSRADAIIGCTAAIRLDPQSPDAFNNRGLAYAAQHDYARAIADYSGAIRLNPQYAQAFNNRGNTYRIQKDYARAIADYDEAIRVRPQFALALYGRGLSKARLGQAIASKADMDRAPASDPKVADQFTD